MPINYVVQTGDTLATIVERECPGTSWRTVARDNNIPNPNLIFPGQVIVLNCVPGTPPRQPPGPRQYIVQAGDTLIGIVSRECPGASYLQVARDNNIVDPDMIQVGQVITLNCDHQGGGPVPPGPCDPHRSAGGDVWLTVPFHSQNDSNSNRSGTDCGPACVRMVIGWQRLCNSQPDVRNPTVNQIWDFIGRRPGQFTSLDDLVRAGAQFGAQFGLNLRIQRNNVTLDRIRQEIDDGRPVIMLCCYGSFNNTRVAFTGGHFVVVVGFTRTHIIIHDPVGWGGAQSWHVSNDVFNTAIRHEGNRCTTRDNPDNTGIFVV